MADKYLILIGIGLVLIGLVPLAMGSLITKAIGFSKGLPVCLVLSATVLIGGGIWLRSLSISGDLIMKQGIAFWLEFEAYILAGSFIAASKKPGRYNPASLMKAGKMMLILGALAIAYQVINVKPVLETLQELGLLKTQDNYKPETNKDCPANLASLYNAFEQYAALNDSLPKAENWQDDGDFTSRVPQDEWMHCPAVSNRHDDKFGYAYNSELSGKKLDLKGKPLKTLPNAATTPLLYNSTDLRKNAHDKFTGLPKPGRHSGRNNVLYLDGHVAAVAPK